MIKAYHSKPSLKKSYIDRLKEHRRLEHLVQGVTFEQNGLILPAYETPNPPHNTIYN